MAGKGALPYDHPLALGAIGATGHAGRQPPRARGRPGDRRRHALSDFTTASKTAFQHPDVRFINDQRRRVRRRQARALPLVGDARATLEELAALIAG